MCKVVRVLEVTVHFCIALPSSKMDSVVYRHLRNLEFASREI